MDLERGFIGIDSVLAGILDNTLRDLRLCKAAVADWGIDFTIQKGLQISLSTVRWFDRNDLKRLEDMLLSVEKERRKRRGPLTR
ncbi:hypothetical protein EDB83DRAFT_2416530 [Lactarius deliciosus]|nr:hypothetical protein EDB83DRAFT_2416530 [Lactarius deliciosus]